MKPGTILVVEDNPVTREAFASALRKRGHEVLEAATGAHALDHLSRRLPDVILQDLALPDADGLDLVDQLRAVPGAAELPIIAVSGDVASVQNAGPGFTDFIPKPVKPAHLVRIVEDYLDKRKESPVEPKDRKHILVVDDDPVQRKLLRILLEKRGFRVTLASDGEDALEKARRSPPDAVISDVLMPCRDGYELCEGLRGDERFFRIPIVLLSSVYIDPKDGEHAQACGATTLMTRSAELEELEKRILPFLVQDPAADHRRPGRWRPGPFHQAKRLAEVHLRKSRKMTLLETGLAMLAGLSQAIRKGGGAEDVLQEILPRAFDAAGLARGAVYLSGEEGMTLQVSHGFNPQAQAWLQGILAAPSLVRQVSIEGESRSKSHEELVDLDLPPPGRVRSLVLSPIPLGGVESGVLLEASTEDRPDLEEESLIHALARQFGQILSVARSLADLQERTPVGSKDGEDVATLLGRLLGGNPEESWEVL